MNSEIKIHEVLELKSHKYEKKKKINHKNHFFVLFIIIFILICLFLIIKNIIYEKKYIYNYISELFQNEKNNFVKEYINNTILEKYLKYLDEKEKKLIKIIEKHLKYLYQIHKYNYTMKEKYDIINILHSQDIKEKKKIRIGRNNDGGYILLDDFENVKIAYSFGIANEISFEKNLADKNIDVFMYDHSISRLPYENPRLYWKKIGLDVENITNKNMKTLNELILL